MNDLENNRLIENYKTVCLCNSVKKGAILKAIRSGHNTVEKINRKFGTGDGNCKDARCQDKIAELAGKESP